MSDAAAKRVVVLGGGSAGFMAALALRARLPRLPVTVIRSKDIGVIGVGEGSTLGLAVFLHEFLQVGRRKFFQVAKPTWKLGLRFLWGPRPYFNYTFGSGPEAMAPGLPRPAGHYCDEDFEHPDAISALMSHDKAFSRTPGDVPDLRVPHSYHFENQHFVQFLEESAQAQGIRIVEDTVDQALEDERGIAGLRLASGQIERADLYIDCSGFVSLLLGKTLREPFIGYERSLFCRRAVIGGWDRQGSPDPADTIIKPYTTCETMQAGWCWQIEHEHRINRGYVYCPDFITDEAAEREFRAANPRLGPTRVVPFVSGRYERTWVRNVVAIGNASGFVEPLEATALGAIGMQSRLLAETLAESGGFPGPAQISAYNRYHARNWDTIRDFLAVHYRFNTRLDTPFWRHCQEHTDLGGAAPYVDYYREVGPAKLWSPILLDGIDSFQTSGYATMLLGQKVPFHRPDAPTDAHRRLWAAHRQRMKEGGARGMTVREALDRIRSPQWRWT